MQKLYRYFSFVITILIQILANNNAFAQPKADFKIAYTTGCNPLTQTFSDKSTGGTAPYTYSWSLGNSNTSTVKNPGAIYIKSGTIKVSLTVTDAKGKTDTISHFFTVLDNPKANFKTDIQSGCAPLDINFSDISTTGSGSISHWLWDFGDGNISKTQNPGKHTYTNGGKYTISLSITDKYGCSSMINRTNLIDVFPAPVVDFSANITAGCTPPVNISFSPKISASIATNYLWDFGDGNTSSSQNPTNSYLNPGLYTVTLTVTDANGCTGTLTKKNYISIGAPTPSFTYNPDRGCALLSVDFLNKTKNTGAGDKFRWNFGDGSSSSDFNPTHIYSSGKYSVSLKVSTAAGCVDSVLLNDIIIASDGFVPHFTADSILCAVPFAAVFKNTSGSKTRVVSWEFGDHTKGFGETSFHTYSSPGNYSITLTTIDNNGCVESLTKKNYASAHKLEAHILRDTIGGCAPFTFNFKNGTISNDTIAKVKWDFGDGKSSSEINPLSHVYANPGRYKIFLTVTTAKGCKSVDSVVVRVGLKPHANFTGYPLSGCLNYLRALKYTNLTNDGVGVQADSFAWFATYARWIIKGKIEAPPGDYSVTLVAYNNGCPDSFTRKDYIHVDPPWSRYDAVRDSCPPNKVYFYDKSIGASRVEYYFGDGDSSSKRSPVHTYKTPGTYFPIMVVFDSSNGCSDTFSFYWVPPHIGLNIKGPLITSLTSTSATSGCLPFSYSFSFIDSSNAISYINFGDGDSIMVSGSDSILMHITHTYLKKGVFYISVSSQNKRLCEQKLISDFKITTLGEKAKFWIDKTRGCVPFTVMLIDSSPKDKKILSKQYDMGNGDIIKISKDTTWYTYKKPPANQTNGFTITQLVADISCSNTMITKVYPTQPFPELYIFDHSNCDTSQFEFATTHGGLGPFKYNWDFGDGTIDFSEQPMHQFNTAGTYKVIVQVKDKFGCIDTLSRKIISGKNHTKPDFSLNVSKGSCPPLTVNFKDKTGITDNGFYSWDWDFGDGSAHAHIQNPVKIYYTAGAFPVSLNIRNIHGCADSVTKPDLITIKGPKGVYGMDKQSGCIPLSVNFNAKTKDASKVTWDLGDGNLIGNKNVTNLYTKAGHYVPLLILSDSSGCTYTLPPKDTIVVYPPPTPLFSYDTTCAGWNTRFHDLSKAQAGTITKWNWDFGDGGKDTIENPTHIFQRNGKYDIKLSVATSNACLGAATKTIINGGIFARIGGPIHACLGEPIQLHDQSKSDSTITFWNWNFGDGFSSNISDPVHNWKNKGIYYVTLKVENAKGCADSTTKPFIVGDTIAPPPPVFYRVTVKDDHTVQMDFSKYQDVDFGKYVIYMFDKTGQFVPIDSLTDIRDTTYYINNLNTLQNVYRFKVQAVNICGYRSKTTQYHATINVTARPAVNAAVISWTPYEGWPVNQYHILRQDLKQPGHFSEIANVSGNILKYVDSSVVCYQPMDYKIEATEKDGYNQMSFSDTSITIPIHVPNVPASEMVRATVLDNKYTKIEWKYPLKARVKNWYLEKSTDGNSYTVLDSILIPSSLDLIDRKVNVQKSSYTYRVKIIDSCGDVGPYSNVGKTILLQVTPDNDLRPALNWTAYENWPDGVRYYDIESKDKYGNFFWLGRTTSGSQTNFTDIRTDLNSQPWYCYQIIAHRNGSPVNQYADSSVISTSNNACLVAKARLFVPNAFTPNGDNRNDSFGVKGMFISDFHMKIFDRWGTKVFETNSMKEKWGGDYKKGQPILDSYKYLIYYRGIDGDEKFLDGWVTILE